MRTVRTSAFIRVTQHCPHMFLPWKVGVVLVYCRSHVHWSSPVICQLEASGKWPDELDAIGKIKTAFYIKMHKLLGQSSVLSSPTVDYIDILMVCMCACVFVGVHVYMCVCGTSITRF